MNVQTDWIADREKRQQAACERLAEHVRRNLEASPMYAKHRQAGKLGWARRRGANA